MWWRREKTDTAEFLYRLLVADSPAGYARTIAERMEIPYSTLSKYWLGKRRFPAALIRPLFLATDQDRRVADFFLLAGSGYRLERKPSGPAVDDVKRAMIGLSKLVGNVADLYLKASSEEKKDAPISPAEAQTLDAAIEALIDRAERLRAAFQPPAPKG